ncbi:hypothetical protein CCR81_08485 [Halorhodospira halophila]|nr:MULTISPECIES: peptidoglycan binding protein CsiV [Halorhodospira]MBK5936845.1 hypothetical protein [Halorhodospira halophila]MBK5942290.1 hypothetical protein [Halorhodospira halophila]
MRGVTPGTRRPRRGLAGVVLSATLLLTGGAGVSVSAQAAEADEWYEVEVIVFRQWEQGGRHAERWPTRADLPHYPLWQIPAGCGSDQASRRELGIEDDPASAEIETDDLDAQETRLHCLPAERRRLTAHWGALTRSDAYQPLYHLAWLQPGVGRDRAVAVPVPYHWTPPTEAEARNQELRDPQYQPPAFGLIRIYRERFLHAAVDLRLHWRAVGREIDEAEQIRAPLHRMQENRRMRSGELHYLDHPALGVLIIIHPADQPPDG